MGRLGLIGAGLRRRSLFGRMAGGWKDLNWSDSEEEEDEETLSDTHFNSLAPFEFARVKRLREAHLELERSQCMRQAVDVLAALVDDEEEVATVRRQTRRFMRRFTPEEDAEILRLHARGLGWAEMVRESPVLHGRCRRVVNQRFKAVLAGRRGRVVSQRLNETSGAPSAPAWLALARNGYMLPPPLVLPPPFSPLLAPADPAAQGPPRRVVHLADLRTL